MTRTRAVLAFDLGTGGTKAALVAEDASVIDSSFVEYETLYPHPGWHEQRPSDWWDAVIATGHELLERVGSSIEVVAISISGQSLALVPTDDALDSVLDAVPIWSDSRATDDAAGFFDVVDSNEWYRRTGNGFPAELYTVFEYRWLLRNRPDVIARTRWVLGSKDWVNARLTGAVATDPSYASGLGAYDLAEHTWATDYLDVLELPASLLPPIVASQEVVGGLTAEAAELLGLPAGVPVVAGGVDNSCMSLGSGLTEQGRMYLSLGSSNWLTIATGSPVLDDEHRPYSFEHVVPGLVISAYSTFAGGSSLTWLADLLEIDVAELLVLAAAEPVGSRGLVCVPTLAGGTVAEGGSDVRGVFLGLDLGHGRGTMARALVEGVALTLDHTAALLAAHVAIPAEILASGGGARSDLLLQSLADLLDRRISRIANDQQVAAIGAAALGFLGAGVWTDLSPLTTTTTATFEPEDSARRAYDAVRPLFVAASEAARATSGLLRAAQLARNEIQE